jgi:membrane-bound inhibitor of C-type lysozyme
MKKDLHIDQALVATIIFVLAFVLGVTLCDYTRAKLGLDETISTPSIIATGVFYCDDGKAIIADFRKRDVSLILSDGREMTIPQTISASGARYANGDESFVFWNKGNTAFIQENGAETYKNCATK